MSQLVQLRAGGATDWSVPEYDIQVDQIEVTCAGNSSGSSGTGVGVASSQISDQQSSDSSANTISADASAPSPASSDSAPDASSPSSAPPLTAAATSANQPIETSTGGSAAPTASAVSDDGESASSPFTVTSGSKISSSAAMNTATLSDSPDPGEVGENVGSHIMGSATAIFASILALVAMTALN